MADEKGRIQVSLYPVSVYDAPSVTKTFLSVLAGRMIELAGFYLPRDDTLQRVSSVLQLPVNDRKQHGRSTTGYRLAEAFLRPILSVLSVD